MNVVILRRMSKENLHLNTGVRLDLIFEGFIAFSQIFLRYFRATLFSRGTNFRAPPLREN